MMRRLDGRAAIGGFLVALGLAAAFYGLRINLDSGGGWGPRLFPLIAAAAILLLGLIEIVSAARRPDAMPAVPAIGRGAVLLLVLSVAYVLLIGRVGYVLATAAAAPLALHLFGVRHPWGLAAATLLCPLAFHLVFFAGLGVFPPSGAWFDLLDLVQGY